MGEMRTRAHVDNQDVAFHAVSGLAAACCATADAIGRTGYRVLYVPVLVIDAPLLQCHLPDGTNEPELKAIARGLLLHSPAPGKFVVMRIVHIEALDEFVAEAQRDSALLAATFDKRLHQSSDTAPHS